MSVIFICYLIVFVALVAGVGLCLIGERFAIGNIDWQELVTWFVLGSLALAGGALVILLDFVFAWLVSR